MQNEKKTIPVRVPVALKENYVSLCKTSGYIKRFFYRTCNFSSRGTCSLRFVCNRFIFQKFKIKNKQFFEDCLFY